MTVSLCLILADFVVNYFTLKGEHLATGWVGKWLCVTDYYDFLQRPWTALTYFFVHTRFLSMLLNMVVLAVVGRMFYRYLGYATFTAGYDSPKRRLYAMASVTPLFSPLGANATAEFGCRISPPAVGAYVFLQCHYGYDEALCDCFDGEKAVPYLRFGIILRPSGFSRAFSL